jgi:RNA polymerase sigma-70 factor (ECF subfamily)
LNDDERLVHSIVDAAAFEPLVVTHSTALHAYLARRAGSEADDLLGEVWLAAFKSRASFDARRGGARAWLFGVARHVLLAHLRRPRAVEWQGAVVCEGVDDGWDRVDERLTADAAGPLLREALASLAPGDREVLLLVAWEQLTPTEAAATLDIPAGTARSRLHRAREQLRTRLSVAGSVTAHVNDTRRS